MEEFIPDNLNVENVPISSIKPYKNNPKIHNNKQVQQIMNSITEFKFTSPILIDENNEILAGHGRLLAAQKLGLTEIPAINLLYLTEAQKKAYRIADNKLTENGKWDFDLLKVEFQDIEKLNIDFSLDITGFDTPELDIIFDTDLTTKEIKLDEKANSVPFIPEDEILSKEGDIWQLGNHRIICGNSLEKSVYEKLLEYKKADMIFTDPPYNVKVEGHVCGNGKHHHKEFAMASGEMSENEFQEFLTKNFTLLKEFSKDGSLHYICMDWRHVKEIILAGSVYDDFENLCVWNKSNGGMGSLYRSKHELIFIFQNGLNQHLNNIELGKHGRYRTNVWDYPGVNNFGDNDNLKFHPTVKPVEMVKDAILDVTKRNGIVLDAFLGSGTTLIAAEKSNRICYGIELEPLYVDTTIRRWQDLTKKSAVHIQTGKTYEELLKVKKETNRD